MTKTLKLTGIADFISHATGNILVKKGETAVFDDDIADKLLTSQRAGKNDDAEPIPYWTEGEFPNPTHDFSKPAEPKAHKIEDAGREEAPKAAARTQRTRARV